MTKSRGIRPPTWYWTEAEHNLFAKMTREGFSAAQIASAIRRSRVAVLGRARRSGIKLRGGLGRKRK